MNKFHMEIDDLLDVRETIGNVAARVSELNNELRFDFLLQQLDVYINILRLLGENK